MSRLFSDNFSYRDVDYTCQCDGSFESASSAGIGVVVYQYPEKKQVYNHTEQIQSKSTVNCELQAIHVSLQLLSELDARNIIIETDLNGSIQKISDAETETASKIKRLLAEFDSWMIRPVNRETIQTADRLAKYKGF